MNADRARELLAQRRKTLEEIIRTSTEQASLDDSQSDSTQELSTADQHPADVATDTLEREVGLSVRESAEASIEDVERALGRVEAGTFGTCPVCGKPIPTDRLEVRPEAEFCVEHTPRTAPLPDA